MRVLKENRLLSYDYWFNCTKNRSLVTMILWKLVTSLILNPSTIQSGPAMKREDDLVLPDPARTKRKQKSKFHAKSPDFIMLKNNSKFSKYFTGLMEYMCRMTQPAAQEFVTTIGKPEVKMRTSKWVRTHRGIKDKSST